MAVREGQREKAGSERTESKAGRKGHIRGGEGQEREWQGENGLIERREG
jgi:hypothetical protein